MPEILNRQAQGEVTHQGNFHYREMTEKRSKIGKKTLLKAFVVADDILSILLVFLFNCMNLHLYVPSKFYPFPVESKQSCKLTVKDLYGCRR